MFKTIYRQSLRSFYGVLLTLIALSFSGQSFALTNHPFLFVSLEQTPQSRLLKRFQTALDSGIAGAEVALQESNSTGKFLGLHFDIQHVRAPDVQQLWEPLKAQIDQQKPLAILADLPTPDLLELRARFPGITTFNVGNKDNQLRTEQCQTGLLHTIPSHAMLFDALSQFLVKKRWKEWLLIDGPNPQNKIVASALKRSAKKFGAKIEAEKQWSFNTDLRRAAQQEIPRFTQGIDYDIAIVIDTDDEFGDYLLYNTYDPRPVAGTHGLTPVAWHYSLEQWGAVQLQERFEEYTQRAMEEVDFASWLAIRASVEATVRSKANDTAELYQYLMSDQFELAAFLGRKLSFRPWSGQLRQPIPLVHPRALVSTSPQEGFLHPVTDLDTLGYDRPETTCTIATSLP